MANVCCGRQVVGTIPWAFTGCPGTAPPAAQSDTRSEGCVGTGRTTVRAEDGSAPGLLIQNHLRRTDPFLASVSADSGCSRVMHKVSSLPKRFVKELGLCEVERQSWAWQI